MRKFVQRHQGEILDPESNGRERVVWRDGVLLAPDVGRSNRLGRPEEINNDGVIAGCAFASGAVWRGVAAATVHPGCFLENSPGDSRAAARAVSASGDLVGWKWTDKAAAPAASPAAFPAVPD